jgi:hypothetical protein
MKEERSRAMTNYEELVKLYTDCLIVVNGQATAIGLSDILDNKIGHDRFTRMLANGKLRSEVRNN